MCAPRSRRAGPSVRRVRAGLPDSALAAGSRPAAPGVPMPPPCGTGSWRARAGPPTSATAPEYQATTTQACGLFPFVAGRRHTRWPGRR